MEHGQDVLHRAAKRSGEAALRGALQAPGLPNQTAGTVDVYGLQILDATLEAGNTEEEDTAASALLLKHEFLGAAGAHAHHAWKFSGALQQPELRGTR